ncbi:MAG: terminase, partial [Gammaproteobacteria bacterium]|nr:terminase [Gammaproteobacteria bacterium]
LHNAIVDGEITYDGSGVLTRHLLNARRRTSSTGIQIAKEHPTSSRKIDAVIAAILAFEARSQAVAAGLGDEVGAWTL